MYWSDINFNNYKTMKRFLTVILLTLVMACAPAATTNSGVIQDRADERLVCVRNNSWYDADVELHRNGAKFAGIYITSMGYEEEWVDRNKFHGRIDAVIDPVSLDESSPQQFRNITVVDDGSPIELTIGTYTGGTFEFSLSSRNTQCGEDR